MFVLVSLLSANAVYLATVSLLDWIAGPGKSYQNYFYPWMVLMHLLLGLLLIVPFIVFGVPHLLAARREGPEGPGTKHFPLTTKGDRCTLV